MGAARVRRDTMPTNPGTLNADVYSQHIKDWHSNPHKQHKVLTGAPTQTPRMRQRHSAKCDKRAPPRAIGALRDACSWHTEDIVAILEMDGFATLAQVTKFRIDRVLEELGPL
jgi:hypothetical protein